MSNLEQVTPSSLRERFRVSVEAQAVSDLVPRLEATALNGDLWFAGNLVDYHCHVSGMVDLVTAGGWGIGRLDNMSGSPFHRSLQAAAAGATGVARLRTTSPIVDGARGNSAFHQSSIYVETETEARSAVQTLLSVGYRDLKVYTHLGRDCVRELSLANAGRMRIVGHKPEALTHYECRELGQERFEHLAGLISELTETGLLGRVRSDPSFATSSAPMERLLATFDWEAARSLADYLAETGASICPTLVIHQPFQDRRSPEGMGVNDRLLEVWERMQDPSPWRNCLLEFYLRLVEVMWNAGVRVLAGTDVPDPYTYIGVSLFDEIELLKNAGLSRRSAWLAATDVSRDAWDATVPVVGPGVLLDFGIDGGALDSVRAIVDDSGFIRARPMKGKVPESPLLDASSMDEDWERRRGKFLGSGLDWTFITFECHDGSHGGLLSVGLAETGAEVLLVEEEHGHGYSARRLIRSSGEALIEAENWYAVSPEGLIFWNRFDRTSGDRLSFGGSFLTDESMPIYGEGVPSVAIGNFSVGHALFVFGARTRAESVAKGIWGACPDQEVGRVSTVMAKRQASRFEVRSLAYGGYSQSVQFDESGMPKHIVVRYEDVQRNWLRVSK